MSKDTETEETEASGPEVLRKFLSEVLVDKKASPELRVNAGLQLLAHFAREGAQADLKHRTELAVKVSVVKGCLALIATDDKVDLATRIRAAGAAL